MTIDKLTIEMIEMDFEKVTWPAFSPLEQILLTF